MLLRQSRVSLWVSLQLDDDELDIGSSDEEDDTRTTKNWEKPFYFPRDGDRPAFSTLFGVIEGPQEKPDDYVAPVVVDIKVEEMRRVMREHEEDFLDSNIKEDTEDDNIKVEEMDRVIREH